MNEDTGGHSDSRDHVFQQSSVDSPADLTIVGIGASAGGLSALKTLFSGMSAKPGVAFVVVVHLSPEHESHLPDLLQPHCPMPVQQVTETLLLEPNRVYVIPPGANLNTIDTHLRLSELEEQRRRRAPIDHFFRTLAETHDGHAIGIVLTGTGSDGTLGLRRIKEQGGVSIVQSPEEAEYDGMPRSAIGAGLANLILPLGEMPAHIERIANTHPRMPVTEKEEESRDESDRVLQKIFAQVRARTGHDFNSYKRSTIMRRIRRRMQLHLIEDLPGYLALLREDREEVFRLFDDLLITVTEFFRDPEVFEYLEKEVVPRLLEGKGPDDHVRVWSVGCSTGEEAYSLAMLLLEEAHRRDVFPQIQVFASDLHDHSLKRAREGLYPESIASGVSPERLTQFFVKENGSYRICKEVRELVVFAPHDLLRDPPFSHLDLVVCRNLLIYLQRDVQHDVVTLFHYALNSEGRLLLGTAETVDSGDQFECVDKKVCLYSRRNTPTRDPRLPEFPLTSHDRRVERGPIADRLVQRIGFGAMHAKMVERYAPPSILVSGSYEIMHSSAHAGQYLEVPGGEPTNNVFKLVCEPLRSELRAALHAAKESGASVRSKPAAVPLGGQERRIVLRVQRASDSDLHGFFLVIFEEAEEPRRVGELPSDEQTVATVKELEADLELNQRRLQQVIEGYESGQEEMQASNEELQSTNEELRSTLEELETSKEELQSMNEELATVNQENRHRVEELDQLSNDLQNLLIATDIATLFLDRELRIVRFTPQVGELFNIRHTDRGRPLSDLTHRLADSQLQDDARRVLRRLAPVEREVQSENGRWYLTRILPYRTTDDRIEGVVITLIDITDRKRAEVELAEAKEYAESIVETLHEPLLVLHPDLTVKGANAAFYEHFQVRPQETAGRNIYDLGNGQWNIPSLRELLEDVLPKNHVFIEYEVTHHFKNIGRRVMLLNGRRLDHVQLILLGVRDITDRKQAERTLRESEQRYRTLFESIDQGFCVIEMLLDDLGKPADYRFLEVNPAFARHTGIEDAVGRRMREIEPGHEEHWFELYGRVALTGEPAEATLAGERLGGRWFQVYAFRIGEPDQRRVAVLFSDITQRMRAEEALRDLNETLEAQVAARTAVAEQRAGQLRALTVELAQAEEQERRRLAQVLHDHVQQILVGAKIQAGLAKSATQEEHSREALAELDRTLSDCIDSTRSLSVELSPPILFDQGLAAALEWLAGHVEKQHKLVVQVEADPAANPASEELSSLLFQAARELLLNVVKHAQAGEARIRLSRQNEHIKLETADRGQGFEPAQAEEAHDSFGLFHLRERLDMLGGQLQIKSSSGEGTSITILLPQAAAADERLEQAPAAPVATAAPSPSSDKIRVLLVDDHQIVRQGLSELIDREADLEVIGQASDGQMAVAMAHESYPDVVVMDVSMPVMSGVDATRSIMSELPHVQVIGLSLHGESEMAQAMLDAGAKTYLTKGGPAEELIEAIRSLCVER